MSATGEPALFIGARADDPHWRRIPGSQPKPCAECQAPTMFSPTSLARATEHITVKFVCLDCAGKQKLLDGITLLPPNDAQVREVRDAGFDESWPLRDQWGKKLQSR